MIFFFSKLGDLRWNNNPGLKKAHGFIIKGLLWTSLFSYIRTQSIYWWVENTEQLNLTAKFPELESLESSGRG